MIQQGASWKNAKPPPPSISISTTTGVNGWTRLAEIKLLNMDFFFHLLCCQVKPMKCAQEKLVRGSIGSVVAFTPHSADQRQRRLLAGVTGCTVKKAIKHQLGQPIR